VKLIELKSYIIPGPIGLSGFYDAGRVWLGGEISKRWHSGYGAGIYFIPYNKFLITAMAGFSGKEKLFNISIGTKINLDF
jgi:hypothetical protein